MPVRLRSVSSQIEGAVGEEAVGLAVEEGRIGEERGGDRLERQADAHLLHHVGFAREVEIGLDGAGPIHHVEAAAADLRHVAGHDGVARFRHHRRLGERPFRARRPSRGSRGRAGRAFAHLGEMGGDLAAGVVDRAHGRAGELELAAGLERDGAAADRVGEADDVALVEDRMPAEEEFHGLEQPLDAARAVIGDRRQIIDAEAEFLVLGADPPAIRRLAALFDRRDKLVARFDRRRIGSVAGHRVWFRNGEKRAGNLAARAATGNRPPKSAESGAWIRRTRHDRMRPVVAPVPCSSRLLRRYLQVILSSRRR